ncbi:hypothetical protein [Winogradskyella sp.]|uniref:hypothetical protein n=1 Tax=Winogradskyella sp. TaxID=1883156 RepID=UPI002619A9E9|nr:hypothetical protein [Winogradskyella sp.]
MKKLFLLTVFFISFFSCTKDDVNPLSKEDASYDILSFVPDGYEVFPFKEFSTLDDKSILEGKEKAIITLNYSLISEEEKSLLKAIVLESDIPFLVAGSEAVNSIPEIVGIKSSSDVVALVYNKVGQGITTEFFDKSTELKETTYQTNAIDFNRLENFSEEEKESINRQLTKANPTEDLESLWSQYYKELDQFKEQYKNTKHFENKKMFETTTGTPLEDAVFKIRNTFSEALKERVTGSANTKTTTDLSEYKLRTLVRHVNTSATYSNNRLGTLPYDYTYGDFNLNYRAITQVAEGTYRGSSEVRIFINSTIKASPGVRAIAVDSYPGDGSAGWCTGRDALKNILERFEPLFEFDDDFDYDDYGPVAGAAGSGSYSNSQSLSIKLKPLKPQEFVELDFRLGQSYSYSMPSYYFTNQTNHFPSWRYKKMSWKWEPGYCCHGSYNNGNGLLSNYVGAWNHDDLFCNSWQRPIPMRQTNKNNVHISISAPKSQVYRWVDLRHDIEMDIRDLKGFVSLWFGCTSGIPYISNSSLREYKAYSRTWCYTEF